jgi:hypothetical protein
MRILEVAQSFGVMQLFSLIKCKKPHCTHHRFCTVEPCSTAVRIARMKRAWPDAGIVSPLHAADLPDAHCWHHQAARKRPAQAGRSWYMLRRASGTPIVIPE